MIEARDGRRVVITGLGVVSPVGSGTTEFWAGLAKPAMDCTLRRVEGFDPRARGLTHIEARRLDRFAQLTLVAALEAVADAGLADGSAYRPEDCGVVIGTGVGGLNTWQTQSENLLAHGPAKVSPLTVPMVMLNSGAAGVSIRLGWRGPVETATTACASGTHAVIAGAKLVAAGRSAAVLVGGSESCTQGALFAGFGTMNALSPSGVSRPFDVDRDGFCCAEAAAALMLEEYGAAKARGATIYAEVVGAGSSADAHHITAPSPDGRGAVRSMRLALADAGVEPAQVTHVNAHGTSTALNDATEALAISTVFGANRPAVTSIKGATGHSLGAAGAVEAVALALSYHHRELPPTMGTEKVDPGFGIDLVTEPRPWTPGVAISNSFAFGGHNATVAFSPV